MRSFFICVVSKAIYLVVISSLTVNGQGFECTAASFPDEDLETTRQIACASPDIGKAHPIDPIVSEAKIQSLYQWNLTESLVPEEIRSNALMHLNHECKISAITMSSKDNHTEICHRYRAPREIPLPYATTWL
ncbi:CSEP0311 putative effector protein [Blumeria hordei DH14]|uniref:CSEP0311 putative effector protein n=1 Tax=Blumeria graminis f. sp. hordei (strain DH14) TaxID=546991 RepID=N1J5Y2_BLUG1|nr:CSEP0311 putative effector protein [Blumeria hordei DH14]